MFFRNHILSAGVRTSFLRIYGTIIIQHLEVLKFDMKNKRYRRFKRERIHHVNQSLIRFRENHHF